MSLHVMSVETQAPVRWKNDGGWTRELLAWPTAEDWALRISVADIEADGPFSKFMGVDRHFAVVSGMGVTLAIDGEAFTLDERSTLHSFAGEADTHCHLSGGPTRDFNLMTRRDRVELLWSPAGEAAPLLAQAHWRGLFTVGGASVREPHGEWQEAPAMSLVWSESPAPWQTRLFGQQPRGWWMQIRLIGAGQ